MASDLPVGIQKRQVEVLAAAVRSALRVSKSGTDVKSLAARVRMKRVRVSRSYMEHTKEAGLWLVLQNARRSEVSMSS